MNNQDKIDFDKLEAYDSARVDLENALRDLFTADGTKGDAKAIVQECWENYQHSQELAQHYPVSLYPNGKPC